MIFNSDVSFFDAQPMFICEQVSLKILDVNKAATDLLGFSKKYLVGKKIHKIASKADVAGLSLSAKAQKKLGSNDIWRIECESGEVKFFQLSAHMINYTGVPSKLVIAHNVTNVVTKKILKGKLLSSQISFNNFPLAEIEWSRDMSITRWSKKAEELFGYSSEEALNEKSMIERFIHKDDLEFVKHQIDKTLEEGQKSSR